MRSTFTQRLFIVLLVLLSNSLFAADVLINFNFQSTDLASKGITTDGALSTSKAGDAVCSAGAVSILVGQSLEVSLPSCEVFKVRMKSSGGSSRTVTIRYKKGGATTYTVASTAVSFSLGQEFNLTNLFPELKSAGPIIISILASSGTSQIHDLYVEASSALSDAAEISNFDLPGQLGNEVINSASGTISINVPMGTSLTAVVPQSINISDAATISPLASAARDFSSEVSYTVTAQDGTTKIWKVTVYQIASSAKEITAFKLANSQIGDASINSSTGVITVLMPQTDDLSAVAPLQISISNNATISPSVSVLQNFNQAVNYTVTAQDNSTRTWQIVVNKVDPSAVYYDYQAESADFTGKTDNQHANFTGSGFVDFLATGENAITFTVCQPTAATQTAKFRYSLAKDDLRAGSLYVNDAFVKTLSFPRTTLFTDWAEEIAVLNLQAGVNKIKITWATTDGPNLDKMSLTGSSCTSYTLNVSSTNSGKITIDPARTDNKYYEGEKVTLLAETKPALVFQNWTGDLTGSTNPLVLTMDASKTITGNFSSIPTYKITVNRTGIGEVILSPEGGEYTSGTVVTLTAKPVLGSVFQGWSGDLTGTVTTQTVTVNANKNIAATFTSDIFLNFNKVVGFASITGDNFTGPTTGGTLGTDTVFIKGPTEFPKLCQLLQDRIKYKTYHNRPLTIVLEEGIYTGANGITASWANSMLTIQEQADLTIIGRKNVVFNFGINIKRSWNIIIRNITFQDYYDDGINIGEPETHHIWVDHCTVGHPTTMPADSEHPDGGIDVKQGASYVTISWTKYRNSWKTGLVGHSDSNAGEDTGRLKVTYYCNHFYHTNSRNPRVRFGQVHVLNNLEEQIGLYGIAAANSAEVYAENNFFLNTRWGMYADRTVTDFKAVFGNNTDDAFTSKTGNYPAKGLKQVGNEFDDSGLPVITSQINPAMLNAGGRSVKFDELNASSVFDPKSYYAYEALPASAVRAIVPMFAGADMVDFFPKSLPLKLLSFKAKKSSNLGSYVELNWQTTNEVNTKSFEVECSKDGKTFQSIGSVLANNTSGLNSYSFNDANATVGDNYYRLKQQDLDGRFTYSNVELASVQLNGGFTIQPNPVVSNLTLNHSEAKDKAVFVIFNLQGQKVLSADVKKGTVASSVDVSGLAPGSYLLSFKNGTEQQSIQFIKE